MQKNRFEVLEHKKWNLSMIVVIGDLEDVIHLKYLNIF